MKVIDFHELLVDLVGVFLEDDGFSYSVVPENTHVFLFIDQHSDNLSVSDRFLGRNNDIVVGNSRVVLIFFYQCIPMSVTF